MCGRYTRARGAIDYVVPLEIDRDQRLPISDSPPSWNVSPGTLQPVIFPNGEVHNVRWGYLPGWAKDRKLPPIINARSEKLLSTWKSLTRRGRILVPADHWFEWLPAADGGKQPYAIRRVDGAPLWMAGLCSVAPESETRQDDGFMIVTAAADQGLVDVHDRRPVVFSADIASEWLNVNTLPEAAVALARAMTERAEMFEYFPVSRDVNRTGRGSVDAPRLVDRIEI